MADKIKAIFFDVGNTLLFRDQQIILKPLHECGLFPSAEQQYGIERRTKKEFDAAMSHGKVDRGFWDLYYRHLLSDLPIARDGLQEELVQATQHSANWCEIRPRTREVLLALGRRYRLAVISNADGKIERVLTRCGIADCFESITDSGIVGHEKPHPAIFGAALQAMKASPGESLYVGDMYSVDYLGATGAGMQGILMDVSGSYRDAQVPRVETMEELQRHLSQVEGCSGDDR
jgi:putative hydrolase of the HAD superfamily